MGTISLTIPVAGSTPFSTAAANVDTDLTTIQTWANGNVDGANVVASLTGRRLVTQAVLLLPGGAGATTYLFGGSGSYVGSGTPTSVPAIVWAYLDPANFAVTGKSNTQLILRMSLATNTVAPAVNFTAQLNAVTFAGSGGSNTPTAGAQVSGSGVAISTPGASSAAVAETTAFTFPTAGAYVPAVVTSGTTAANSATMVTVQLFVLNS